MTEDEKQNLATHLQEQLLTHFASTELPNDVVGAALITVGCQLLQNSGLSIWEIADRLRQFTDLAIRISIENIVDSLEEEL